MKSYVVMNQTIYLHILMFIGTSTYWKVYNYTFDNTIWSCPFGIQHFEGTLKGHFLTIAVLAITDQQPCCT